MEEFVAESISGEMRGTAGTGVLANRVDSRVNSGVFLVSSSSERGLSAQ